MALRRFARHTLQAAHNACYGTTSLLDGWLDYMPARVAGFVQTRLREKYVAFTRQALLLLAPPTCAALLNHMDMQYAYLTILHTPRDISMLTGHQLQLLNHVCTGCQRPLLKYTQLHLC